MHPKISSNVHLASEVKKVTELPMSPIVRSAKLWLPYLGSIGLVAAVTIIARAVLPFIQPSSNLVMLYLFPVVLVALNWGAGPSVLTSILSILAYRFFFVPHVLPLSQIDDYIMFLTVVIVGLVVATLATRSREQAIAAQHAAARTTALYALSRDLAAAGDLDSVVRAVVGCISDILNCDVVLLLPAGEKLVAHAATRDFLSGDRERSAAVWAFQHGQATGRGASVLSEAQALYLPMKSLQRVLGVLGVRPGAGIHWTDEHQRMLEAFASQAAIAIERAELAEEARQAYLHQATEKMQTALLIIMGPSKLAGIGGGLGKSIHEFRKAMKPDEEPVTLKETEAKPEASLPAVEAQVSPMTVEVPDNHKVQA